MNQHKRYSDRPQKSGGVLVRIGTLIVGFFGGGIVLPLALRVVLAKNLGAGGYFMLAPGIGLIDGVLFCVGAGMGTYFAWKAWGEAVKPD